MLSILVAGFALFRSLLSDMVDDAILQQLTRSTRNSVIAVVQSCAQLHRSTSAQFKESQDTTKNGHAHIRP